MFFEKDYRDNKIVGLVDRWSLFRGSHAEVVTRSAEILLSNEMLLF